MWLVSWFGGGRLAAIEASAHEKLGEDNTGPLWCVVANVVLERPYGPGGIEKRRGTKHFAPGAKVYIIEFYNDAVMVVGRHRKSHRFIRLMMNTKHLANWRAEAVYSPYVISQIRTSRAFGQFGPNSAKGRENAEQIAARFIKAGAASQPFVTRSPSHQPKMRDET